MIFTLPLLFLLEIPVIDDVDSATVELVDKMESFNVGSEKISALKTVAIKLEVYFITCIKCKQGISYCSFRPCTQPG